MAVDVVRVRTGEVGRLEFAAGRLVTVKTILTSVTCGKREYIYSISYRSFVFRNPITQI